MNAMTLAITLNRNSNASGTGTGALNIVALITQTVGATIAFLVAGGTMMFWQRAQQPELANPQLVEVYGHYGNFLDAWFYLALFACAFLIPVIFNLIAQAAVLGASGKEQRLATLRLLGLSSRQTTRMVISEVAAITTISVLLGGLISRALVPLFTGLSFQARPLAAEEIVLEWWGYLAVGVALVLLAIAAAYAGMRRVRVSPLGVARRQVPPTPKLWVVIMTVVVVIASMFIGRSLTFSLAGGVVLSLIALFTVIVGSISLLGPTVLRAVAHGAARLPGTTHYVAWRRIAADSKRVWRRTGALAFFGFLAGFLVMAPIGNDGLTLALQEDAVVLNIMTDVSAGALLTLVFGFCLVAASLALGQANAIVEGAELGRTMSLMGISRKFQTLTSVFEVMGPATILSFAGFFFGSLNATVMFGAAGDVNLLGRITTAFALLVAGLAVTAVAMLAVEPIRRQVLSTWERKE